MALFFKYILLLFKFFAVLHIKPTNVISLPSFDKFHSIICDYSCLPLQSLVMVKFIAIDTPSCGVSIAVTKKHFE